MSSDDDLLGFISRHLLLQRSGLSRVSDLCQKFPESENTYDRLPSWSQSSKICDSGGSLGHDQASNSQSRDWNTLQSLIQSYAVKGSVVKSHRTSTLMTPCEDLIEEHHLEDKKHLANTDCRRSNNHQDQPQHHMTHKYNMIVSRNSSVMPKKQRITWTQELHEKFINCVDHLGGSKRATPKAILKLMNSEGLTIFHIKSHLQKYRSTKTARHQSQPSSEGNSPRSPPSERIDQEMGIQIVEALRLQLDVQRSLCEQLENQRKLQLQIEEQAKQLQQMLNSHLEEKSSAEDC